jgi:hypothetical protein
MNSKKTNKFYLHFAMVMSLIASGLVVALIVIVSKDRSEDLNLKIKMQQNEQAAISQLLHEYIELEGELLISSDKQRVLNQLKVLQEKDSLKVLKPEWLENRRLFLQEKGLSEVQKDSGRFYLLQINQKLKLERDSLTRKIIQVSDSLFFSYSSLKTENVNLKNQLADQASKLRRKDKVQVISFISTSGKRIHYLGEVEDGKANGNGIGIWSNGSIYRGSWRNNMRHGKGSFEWEDGDKYEGEFAFGQIEGEGTYFWKSGERYEGDFKNNRRNGNGTLFDKDGNVKIQGEWKDDKPL